MVLLKRDRDLERVPHAEDVLLLVEVAEGSLRFDRRIKIPRYAEAGVPEVWIVNLVDDRIESYRHPSASGYTEQTVFSADEPAPASLVPQLGGISIRDIFGS